MEKRFRDQNGRLKVSLADLSRFTREEGELYYQPGQNYYCGNRRYMCSRHQDRLEFHSADGYTFTVPLASCGTFLPSVASCGSEIFSEADFIKVNRQPQRGQPCSQSCEPEFEPEF